MKTKIINLVGASGSGKTTIAKELDKLDNINVIQSYTTRPPRSENEWGHTFIRDGHLSHGTFYEKPYKGYKTLKTYSKIIAYFNSYKSGHHYFATDDQIIRGKTNIYVVDPGGAKQVHEYYKDTDVEVITIGIYEDRHRLISNLEEREGINLKEVVSQINPDNDTEYWESEAYKEYEEKVMRRINKDKDLFKIIKCNYMIKGSNNALEFIKEIIKE